MEKILIEALKNKYRFEYKGLINVEDLFDINLKGLDQIYRDLKKVENDLQSDSLLDANENPLKKETENKIKIVKNIFEIKVEEIEQAKIALAKKAQREKILAIIENKQDQELSEKSIKELRKIYDSLLWLYCFHFLIILVIWGLSFFWLSLMIILIFIFENLT